MQWTKNSCASCIFACGRLKRQRLDWYSGINSVGRISMQTTKQEVTSLLEKLPDDSSLEDVQYHLYVIEKIRRGVERAESEGALSQEQTEQQLKKWLAK